MFFKFTALMRRVRRFCVSDLRCGQVLAFFSRIPRCVVGLEACATAHYWARELGALGHEVRLMPAQYVKAYIKRNKHDAADAEAICEAVQRPTMRFVPVKTADQQAAVLLHRGRERLVRQRTGLVNALRGQRRVRGRVKLKQQFKVRKTAVVSFGLSGEQDVFRSEATGAASIVASRFGADPVTVRFNTRKTR